MACVTQTYRVMLTSVVYVKGVCVCYEVSTHRVHASPTKPPEANSSVTEKETPSASSLANECANKAVAFEVSTPSILGGAAIGADPRPE